MSIFARITRLFGFAPAPKDPGSADFEAITGEPVTDTTLYVQAMRHRSLSRGRGALPHESNERLEYLGDAVLGFVTADYLYARYPDEDEGFLTRLRSKLVSGKALARRAESIGLGALVLLSENAVLDRGRANQNILADAFEALIGAVYLDQGLEAARRFVVRVALDPVDLESVAHRDDNHKSLLLEFAQGRGWPQPVYRVLSEEGPDHERQFTVEAVIGEAGLGTGRAGSKKRAEQIAAASALETLENDDTVSSRIERKGAS